MAKPTTSQVLDEQEEQLINAYWRAANYLSVGQIYLLDNPLLHRPLVAEDVKPRLLGHWGTTPGLNFVYAHMNRLIKAHDVDAIFMAGPGHGGPAAVANAYLEGTYTEYYSHITRRRGGHPAAVQAVLVPRRHSQPRRPGDPRVDPRGRRTRLRPVARLRRRVRQSRSAGLRGGRGRRGGDRAPGRVLAQQQVPRPGQRRRGAADPAPERLQDRQPDGARPHPAGGTDGAAHRLRPRGALRRGRRPGGDARADGADAGDLLRPDPGDPGGRQDGRRHRAPAVADDRDDHPEGLDRSEGDRGSAVRGHLAFAPGAADRHQGERRAPGRARGVDAVLPARGTVRRRAARCARRSPRWRPRATDG